MDEKYTKPTDGDAREEPLPRVSGGADLLRGRLQRTGGELHDALDSLSTASDETIRHVVQKMESVDQEERDQAFRHICKWITSVGGSPEDVLSAWKVSDTQKHFPKVVEENLRMCRDLEGIEPGIISRLLAPPYRIRNFRKFMSSGNWSSGDRAMIEKYSGKALLANDRECDLERRYGIILSGLADEEQGALRGVLLELLGRFDCLYESLHERKIPLRLSEAGGRAEAMSNLRAFHERYWEQAKEEHKPELLVFVGHGLVTQEGAPARAIGLGKGHRFFGGRRDWEKIPQLCAYLHDFLAPGATIILESCATGADGALAQELSKNLPGMTVIAPKYTTQSIAIGVEERPGGAMVFKPEGYGGLNGDGTVRIFRDGVVVEEIEE